MPAGIRDLYFIVPKNEGPHVNSEKADPVEIGIDSGILSEDEMMDGCRLKKNKSLTALKDKDGNTYTNEFVELSKLDFDSLDKSFDFYLYTELYHSECLYRNKVKKLKRLKDSHKICKLTAVYY